MRDRTCTWALGLATLAATLGCTPPPDPQEGQLRARAVEAVHTRFDARGCRVEMERVQGLRILRLYDPDGKGAKGPLRATCWFDRQARLVTVVYPD